MTRSRILILAAALVAAIAAPAAAQNKITLLNVSYDPTRELYSGRQRRVREALAGEDRRRRSPSISRTAAPASRRAPSSTASRPTSSRWRSRYDIDAIADMAKLIPADWQKRLPNNSAPYTSTIVFLVRKGNPKHIKDWDDLVQPGVSVDHAEPEDLRRRALELPGGLGLRAASKSAATTTKAQEFVRELYKNVPVLDSGARGATTTFVAARHRRRADRVGERSAPARRRSSGRISSRSSCRRSASSPSRRWRVVDKSRRQARHPRRSRRRTSSSSTRPRGRRSRRGTTTVRARRRRWRSTRSSSRRSRSSRSTRCSAAGRRRRRRTSTTAASSIGSIEPGS